MEHRIYIVIIGVENMARAVAFYKRLGLPLKFQTPAYSEFETDGSVLALEKRKRTVSSGPSFTLRSKNIRVEARTLKKLGVKLWKPLIKEPFGWVLFPKDSEGNIFEIVQYAK